MFCTLPRCSCKRKCENSSNTDLTGDENGRLFGIVDIDVENVEAGETRDFSISLVGYYSEVDAFEVRVFGI